MEKPRFDGKAIKRLADLVEHDENQQERSRQPSADVGERHGSTNSSKEEKRVP
jgi:hypothetical protein